MAVQVLPSDFGMSSERLAALMKDSWQPLDTLGRGDVAVAQLKNQQDFERQQTAARTAAASQLQSERIQQESAARQKEIEQAEKMKSRLALEQQARTYRVPVVDANNNPRPESDIINDVQEKALKAAKSVKDALDKTNARIDEQLKGLYNYKPNIGQQQQRAMAMVLNDPQVAAQMPAATLQEIKDKFASGKLDLFSMQHGLASVLPNFANRSPAAAKIIEASYTTALQRVQDIDQQNYAANAQAKQKALLEEKARVAGPLAAEFARHYANVAPDDQPDLLKEGEPPPAQTPEDATTAALNALKGKGKGGTPTPPPAAATDEAPQIPVPDGTPDKYNPNVLAQQARQDTAKAAREQQVQQAAQQITSLQQRQSDIEKQLDSGKVAVPSQQLFAGAGPGAGPAVTSPVMRDLTPQERAALAAERIKIMGQVESLKGVKDYPAIKDVPDDTPQQVIPSQPSASVSPEHQQLGTLANQLAMQDGIPIDHIKQIVAASQNPQDPGYAPAKQLVQSYLARAQSMLSQSDATTNAFRVTAQQPDDQPA